MKSYKLVGLERRSKLFLGIILKNIEKQNKLEIYTSENEKITIPDKKIIWRSQLQIEADNEKNIRIGIQEYISSFTQDIDLRTLWELLEEQQSYLFGDLVDTYFGSDSEIAAGSLFLALENDKLYFKINNGTFDRNATSNVEVNIRRIEAQKNRQEKEQNFINWFTNYHPAPNREVPEEFIEQLTHLKNFALKGEERCSQDEKRLAAVLSKTADELLLLLENKELLAKNINEVVYRLGLSTTFSKEVSKETENILQTQPDWENRTVIKDLWNIAIDDEETKEVDDAISYHREDQLHVVGIHIADVDATIARNTALDKFASDRFATLYFPDEKFPLFPFELVKEKLTLETNSPRPTLSGFFYFDDAMNLVKKEFIRATFVLQKRATYEDSLGDLGEEPNFVELHKIAESIKKQRHKQGAIITNFPELKLKVNEDKVELHITKNKTPAHLVVSEFMIFFNCHIAQLLSEKKVPAFYRVQELNSPTDELDKNDPLYPLQIRRCLGTASLSASSGTHATLGLTAYTQGTSPIRRYSDLVIHRQIFSILADTEPCYSAAILKEKMIIIERNERLVKLAENERFLFWFYKYLKSQKGGVYKGLVSRLFENNRVMIFLPDFCQEFSLKLERQADAKIGRELKVKIHGASPRKKRLHLAQVS